MAQPSTLDAGAWKKIQRKLEAIDDVSAALRQEDVGKVWLVCQAGADRSAVEAAARKIVAADDVDIEIVIRNAPPSGRVRFEGVDRTSHNNGRVTVAVRLSWRGREAAGEVLTEEAPPLELRGAANAALQALETVLGRELGLRLVGVKQLRAFDADVIAVSLHRSGPDRRFYVGAVLATDEPLHGAAIAVLDALNRVIATDAEA